MTMELVNQQPKYSPPHFRPPPSTGYVYIGASVEPPKGRRPFPGYSASKKELLSRLARMADRLAEHPEVQRVTIYRAVLSPPTGGGQSPAPFDVAVLVETSALASLDPVTTSDAYVELLQTLERAASHVHVMPAECIRDLGEVDKTRSGTYLFNHFVTETTREEALALWDELAGWYAVETDLDNSTLLAPRGDSAFVFVNHARWPHRLPWVMLHQLPKRSFRTYVLANLKANHVTAYPVLSKVVATAGHPR
jgi:hypothetical protein